MNDDDHGATPDPAALFEEVQRLGEVAAARVAEQFTRMVQMGTGGLLDGTSSPTADEPVVGGVGVDDAVRAARARAERAIDTAMGALGDAIHGYAIAVESALRRANPTTAAEPSDVVEIVVADGRGAAAVWLHRDAEDASEAMSIRVGPLVRADGEPLVATIGVDPPKVDPLMPGERRELQVEVLVDDPEAAGRYHGVVVATPGDLAVRLVVDVGSRPTNES
jgi:hypothetical protein